MSAKGDDSWSVRLPPEVRSVGRARAFVADNLSQLVDPADVMLMTSELVDNAVRHAASDVTLTVRGGPPIRVEVHDEGAVTEEFRHRMGDVAMPDVASSSGRGLAIVRALASRTGVDDDDRGGKVVWFESDSG